MRGVGWNATRFLPSPVGSSWATGMLDTARNACGTVAVSAMLALKAGSSPLGEMGSASAGSRGAEFIRLGTAAGGEVAMKRARPAPVRAPAQGRRNLERTGAI